MNRTSNTGIQATLTIKEGYELGSAGVTVTMGGSVVTSGITVDGNTITINITSVTGNVTISVPTKSTTGGDEPVEPGIAYYVVNKNIWSDGELTDNSGRGRIAITTYFPTDGKELSVSSSIKTHTIAKRYYDSDKVGGAAAAGSAYGRVVLVMDTGGTALVDNYAGETLTVNGTVYTLQVDPEYAPKHVAYATKANINADGELVENYSEFRVSILDYFETGGKALTIACSLGGTAVRYYDANKVGGITDSAQSTYGRVVIYSIAEENQNDAAVEGTALTVNGKSYILSNNQGGQ